MQKEKQKIKRIKPIIKVKESEVEKESIELAKIQKLKNELNLKLKESQSKYIKSIDDLNKLRASSERNGLHTLENGIDYLKKQWTEIFVQIKELDRKEQAQIQQLSIIMSELKSVEKLSEKYKEEFNKKRSIKEQLIEDEASIHRLLRSNIG